MRLLWQRHALADIHRAAAFIKQDNPIAAEKTAAAIEVTTRNLMRYPEIGRVGKQAGTRELVVTGTPYFVVYRISGEDVQILRVLHGRQKWPSYD
jgi:toxin ParE1/3/4